MSIFYKSGYKYQLKKDYSVQLEFTPKNAISTEFVKFTIDGVLTLKSGYAWDGPSGPTPNTKNIMRGSLVHDGLYQLMRENHLNHLVYRKLADKELRRICIEDGMWHFRAATIYLAVRIFGNYYADPSSNHAPETAP